MENVGAIIGHRIKELRERLGLTQAEFAAKISLTPSAITQYERSLRTPSVDILVRIVSEFSVNANYLLGCGESPHLLLQDEGAAFLEAFGRLSRRDRTLVMQLVRAMQDSITGNNS